MKLLTADFVTSAAAGGGTDGIPREGLQIALAGRSNVGKSSLINALCRKPIARTSAAPGKTRLANVYRATLSGGAGGPGRWSVYLVDLPGYGYARGGADSARELAAVAEAYLNPGPGARDRGPLNQSTPADCARPDRQRTAPGTPRAEVLPRPLGPRPPAPGPDAVLLVIDARHPGLESDLAAAEWLRQLGIGHHIVATKIDKLSRAERARNLRTIEDTFGTAALPVSAESGEGLDALWQMIAKTIRDAEARR